MLLVVEDLILQLLIFRIVCSVVWPSASHIEPATVDPIVTLLQLDKLITCCRLIDTILIDRTMSVLSLLIGEVHVGVRGQPRILSALIR